MGTKPNMKKRFVTFTTSALIAGIASAQAPAQPEGLFEVNGEGAANDAKAVQVDSFGRIDLAVKDLEIAKVLQLLSIQSQKNIVTSKSVSGTVSADLYGVTFAEALNAVLEPNGFAYEEKGNFIYVYTKAEWEERQAANRKMITKIVRLNYLNGEDAKTIAETMKSSAGSVAFSSEADSGFQPSSTDAGGNGYAMSDALVLRDYEENIAAIEAIIHELDERPKQVLIEATVLQARLSEENAFGVDFSVFSNLSAFNFSNPLNAVTGLISGAGNNAPGDGGGAVTSGVGNVAAGKSGVKVGYVGSDAAVFVRALDSVTDTTVMAKPNILVLNRQKADLLVGERLGYLSTTVTDTSQTQSVEFLDVGTQLTVRPFISHNNTIRMELRPAISDGEVTIQEGFTIPNETTQELVTNVIVDNGQTIVLGGLFKEDTTYGRNQVPGLGDIPLLGAAFQGRDNTMTRSEVIFLIKPSIVESAQLAKGAAAANENIRNRMIGARNGLLPWSNDKLVSSNLLTAQQALAAGDNQKALWHTNLALHLAPTSADALALKQKITGDQIAYFDRRQLTNVFDAMVDDQVSQISPEDAVSQVPVTPAPAAAPVAITLEEAPAPVQVAQIEEVIEVQSTPVVTETPAVVEAPAPTQTTEQSAWMVDEVVTTPAQPAEQAAEIEQVEQAPQTTLNFEDDTTSSAAITEVPVSAGEDPVTDYYRQLVTEAGK